MDGYSAHVQVLVLGPVTIVDHGAIHDVLRPRHRAVLTTLALCHGAPVSAGELIDAIWGETPPASARKTLQGYVASLRKRYGDDLIETVPGAYRLGPAVDGVDADDFELLVNSGRQLLELGDALGALGDLSRALALWRGRPAEDLAPSTFHEGQSARLDELRALAHEASAEAELALGHHHEVVPGLEQLVGEHPYREALWRSLMLAHYRAGNAGRSLDSCGRLRGMLRAELDIDLSAETRALEQRMLARDPSLDFQPTPRGNLAEPLDSFVGRRPEVDELTDLVRAHRLVTIAGIGGVGKSRLANEVARTLSHEHPGGAWSVDLTGVSQSSMPLGLVLEAMRLPVQAHVPPGNVLLAYLRRHATLLVLDNCEHVHEVVSGFVEWLASNAPDARILATSRVPLGVHGERIVRLGPLSTDGADSDGGRLFADRVAARGYAEKVESDDVAAIIDAVGGLPLGIELAAAQTGVRTTAEIARRLHDRRQLLALSVEGDDRHHSLSEVIGSTIDALPFDAADALPRLAVFTGDFALDAATVVLGTRGRDAESMMATFLDSSLVTVEPSPPGCRRFRMLWPVRELVLARSNPATTSAAMARFAEHFRQLAREFLDVVDRPSEVPWLVRERGDDHNLRSALAWWEQRDPLAALDFGPALGCAWMLCGDQIEGRDTLRRLLAGGTGAPSGLVAATELELSFLELLSGDAAAAHAVSSDAIARFETLDEPRGLSRALRMQAHALHLGGFPAEVTDPLYQRSLDIARHADLTYSQALTEVHFAHASGANEEWDRVDRMLPHAEAVLRRHGDHGVLAHAALGRALAAFGRRDPARCRRHGEVMLREARLAGDTIWMQIASVLLGVTWYELGDEARSHRFFRDALHLAHETANAAHLGVAFHALAATMAGSQPEGAARLWGVAGTLTPLWPLHARRYGEWMSAARDALGEQFDDMVAAGAASSVDDAVRLADRLL